MTGGARRRRRVNREQHEEIAAAVESMQTARDLSELSEEEWIAYLKAHYRPSVVGDLIGIQQTAADARQPGPKRSKRRTNHSRRVTHVPETRANRYIVHVLFLTLAMVMMGRTPIPLVVVVGMGVIGVIVLLTIKDALTSAISFTVRVRFKTGSANVNVRVRDSSWDISKVGRLLNLALIFLPPELRAESVEDLYANLLERKSTIEGLDYLIDLIPGLARIAWQFYTERKRDSVK